MKILLILLTFIALALGPGQVDAKGGRGSDSKEPRVQSPPSQRSPPSTNPRRSQTGGLSLAQAIESVRSRTNGKIVGAETRVKGGREVHYIKVLKNGTVKTHKVNGRRR